MALISTVTTEAEVVVIDAYSRVENLHIYSKGQVSFVVRSYVNKNANVSFHEQNHACSYDISGQNPIQQAYEYVRSLPIFHGAVDA